MARKKCRRLLDKIARLILRVLPDELDKAGTRPRARDQHLARQTAEAQAQRRAKEAKQARLAAVKRLEHEAAYQRQAEVREQKKEQARQAAEAERLRLEQERLEAEAEAKRQAEAEEQTRQQAEAERLRLEQDRLAAEAEAQRQAEAEEQARQAAEAEAKRQAEAEEQARQQAEAERLRLEQDRLAAEAEAKRRAREAEEARLAAVEQLRREAASRRQAEVQQKKTEWARQQAEVERLRQKQTRQSNVKVEGQAKEEEQARQQAEAERLRLEQDRLTAEAEAKRQAEEEDALPLSQEGLDRETGTRSRAADVISETEQLADQQDKVESPKNQLDSQVEPEDWQKWKEGDWNRCLLRYCFLSVGDSDTKIGVPSSVEDLRFAVGDLQSNPYELAEAFIKSIITQAERHNAKPGRLFTKRAQNWNPDTPLEPPFFAFLWATCLISQGYPDPYESGEFHMRYPRVFGPGQASTFKSLKLGWEKLSKWLEQEKALGGKDHRRLTLPTQLGKRTNIG